ncbi:hypothetical protein L596_011020 [Steinernema carpocapsae]|uniref:Uncharacterized protein n=1 Tax=Steinernema carpocapsae TaxID=34508 RepID=A0A4V6A4B6_STECR|nr:hypothetical protein L596_011020 [Steinernema carpocapsae]
MPNYPDKPKTSYHIFLSKHSADSNRGFPSKEVTALYNANIDEKNKCDEQARQLELAYIENLREFVEQHKELLPEHSQFIMNKISKLVKKHNTKPSSPTKKKKTRAIAKKLSAYDFFKQSKKNKYTDLDEEARENKLRKKFDKLDESLKAVFQELAENQA